MTKRSVSLFELLSHVRQRLESLSRMGIVLPADSVFQKYLQDLDRFASTHRSDTEFSAPSIVRRLGNAFLELQRFEDCCEGLEGEWDNWKPHFCALLSEREWRGETETKSTQARDKWHELWTAAMFRRAGFVVSPFPEDVCIHLPDGQKVVAQAKRTTSRRTLRARVADANRQVGKNPHPGIAVIDLSEMLKTREHVVFYRDFESPRILLCNAMDCVIHNKRGGLSSIGYAPNFLGGIWIADQVAIHDATLAFSSRVEYRRERLENLTPENLAAWESVTRIVDWNTPEPIRAHHTTVIDGQTGKQIPLTLTSWKSR